MRGGSVRRLPRGLSGVLPYIPVNALTHRSGLPAEIELDGDEDPPWSRISYTDGRDSLPDAEPSCRWLYESVRGGVEPVY